MRNKKKSLLNVLKKKCTKKVRLCTIKFCATGCLVDNSDVDHRESLCICDDHIIAFEAVQE